MRKNTNRMGRVDGEIKREVSQVINYELKNSKVNGIVSVTRVKVTPDLRYAKIYISVLDPRDKKKTLEGLNSSKGFIRSRIANTINLRITPELVFVYDDSEEQGERIDQILRELRIKSNNSESDNENENENDGDND